MKIRSSSSSNSSSNRVYEAKIMGKNWCVSYVVILNLFIFYQLVLTGHHCLFVSLQLGCQGNTLAPVKSILPTFVILFMVYP